MKTLADFRDGFFDSSITLAQVIEFNLMSPKNKRTYQLDELNVGYGRLSDGRKCVVVGDHIHVVSPPMSAWGEAQFIVNEGVTP